MKYLMTFYLQLDVTKTTNLRQGLFVLFLLVYGIAVIAKLGMILLISVEPRLHTPMYYFLSNLSFSDICYSSVSPKMLADFLSQQKKIAYSLCAVQISFWGTFADVECVMLSVMAYYHYIAICNPFLHTTAMSGRVCTQLAAIVYIQSLVYSAIVTYCTIRLSFYNSNIINHFFCDFPPLLALSTSDTTINEIVMFTYSSCALGFSIVTILLSYSYVINTILRMKSAKGRHKAFSTCASHLTAVAMFYGTLLFMYFQPSSSHSMDTDQVASVFYTVVIPRFNPLIYSLRNKDVKDALKKSVGTKLCSDGSHVFTQSVHLKIMRAKVQSIHNYQL
ncbi:olfactory receptor 5AR1-like [Phyllostomus discolor]|uniref:Olfactory receptor 5AR1-like n=1 Tax=Phyllostomus discolor TaxID=89673 RepID=A0A6J2LSS5_9CHIR|nr:olfactory receptor 5AR1-like [Phyllostomus discolor]